MRNESRSRECQEGWTGRRRNYRCIFCGDKFQHDGGRLPEKARICDSCIKGNPVAKAQFHKVMEERDVQ